MSMRPYLRRGLRLKLLGKPGTSGDAKQLTGWRGNSGSWGESSATRRLSFAATWINTWVLVEVTPNGPFTDAS